MPKVARLGDIIGHSFPTGSITTASSTTQCDGMGVARVGDTAQCSIHGMVTIVSGSSDVMTDNQAIARVGDSLSCGATILDGGSREID